MIKNKLTISGSLIPCLTLFIGLFVYPYFNGIAQTSSITIIQVTDPQFGFFDKNESFEKETGLYTRAVEQINAIGPDFVIITGDFVNNPLDMKQISEFKRITAQIKKDIPVYLSPGNHDLGQSPAKKDFLFYYSNYGSGKDRFSFTLKNASFIGFNSVIIKSNKNEKEEKKQLSWLKRQLKKARSSGMVVLFTHYPFFISDFNEKDSYSNQTPAKRVSYFNLFEKYGADAVFAGHLHNNSEAEHNGILMITTGAAGKPLGEAKPGFRVISIHGDSLETWYKTIE